MKFLEKSLAIFWFCRKKIGDLGWPYFGRN